MKPPPLPALSTLSEPPSWLNNGGSIDRAACFEIRSQDVRQLAGCVTVRQGERSHSRKRFRDARLKVRQLPNEVSAVNTDGRVATGVYELSPYDLELVAQFRVPRAMGGDHRSARANAMNDRRRNKIHHELHGSVGDGRVRDAYGKPRWKTNVRGVPRDKRDEPLPEERLATNAWPNLLGHGKVLGVTLDWKQPVRLEKWLYGKDRPTDASPGELGRRGLLPKYYLVCPGVMPDGRRAAAQRAHRERGQRALKKATIEAGHAMTIVRPAGIGNDARLAPLSNRPAGTKLTGKKVTGCRQRVRSLLLPLCWQEEYDDAMVAQRWLVSLTVQQRHAQADMVAKLEWRYGQLFAPRTLLCAGCLDVKYGSHPEKVRQAARKRNHAWKFNPIVK